MSSFFMREGDIIFVAFCVAVETEAGGEMEGGRDGENGTVVKLGVKL